jgi:hypothetical protein
MAKRKSRPAPVNVSVNTSTVVNSTDNTSEFRALIELQKLSNEHLQSMRDSLAQSLETASDSLLTQRIQTLEELSIQKETQKQEKETEKISETLEESLKIQKQLLKAQTEAALAVSSTIKTFKSFGEGFQEFKANIRQNFSTVSRALLSTRLVKSGSMMDRLLGVSKRAARDDFIDRQRMLGSSKSKKELQADYKEAARVSKDIKKTDNEIEIFKRKTGLNEEQMANTEAGKALLDRKADLGQQYSKHDMAAQVAKDSIKDTRSQTISEEDQQEAVRRQEEQTDVLKEIAKNTMHGPDARVKPNEKEEGAGGGFLGALAGGVGMLGAAFAKLGKGLGSGLQRLLRGVALGFAYFFNPATLVGMGAFTLAAMGIGKALEMAAPAIEAFAPVLIKIADVIQNVFVEGIKAIPQIIEKIGDVIMGVIKTISEGIVDIIDQVTTSIERLSKIDGTALAQVGAGLLAVSAGMAAFAAGNAVAGLSNLATGLLSKLSGQKSPVEQLEDIAKLGPGLQQAGIGIEKLSAGLKGFSSVDGSTVSNMSNQVNSMKDKAGVSSTTVVAPSVSNNMKQTQIARIEAPVRSSDSSVERYFSARAVY